MLLCQNGQQPYWSTIWVSFKAGPFLEARWTWWWDWWQANHIPGEGKQGESHPWQKQDVSIIIGFITFNASNQMYSNVKKKHGKKESDAGLVGCFKIEHYPIWTSLDMGAVLMLNGELSFPTWRVFPQVAAQELHPRMGSCPLNPREMKLSESHTSFEASWWFVNTC